MKRLIIALAVVAAVAAVGFGSAAALTIDGRDLGAGTAPVENGAPDGVTVSYGTNIAGPGGTHPYGGFGVWAVHISGLDVGERVLVALMDNSATPQQLAFFEGTAGLSGVADCTYHYAAGWKTGFACWADEVYRVDIVTKSNWAPGDGSPP
jgi:hypothetical protein